MGLVIFTYLKNVDKPPFLYDTIKHGQLVPAHAWPRSWAVKQAHEVLRGPALSLKREVCFLVPKAKRQAWRLPPGPCLQRRVPGLSGSVRLPNSCEGIVVSRLLAPMAKG